MRGAWMVWSLVLAAPVVAQRRVAATLDAGSNRETVAAICAWVEANLAYDPEVADTWRTLDEILADASYGSCADHSVITGALTRACGIPTVWVKTLDLDWIREFRAGLRSTWRGHVFLTLFLDGR